MALLSACVDKEKGKLNNRAIDFWKFKIEKRFDKAYEFLSPGWRSGESKESYVLRMGQSKIKWTDVKVAKKTCSQKDLCQLLLEITYLYKFKGAVSEKMEITTQVSENWLLKDNNWYHVPIKKNIIKR